MPAPNRTHLSPVPSHTIARRAEAEDQLLWASSSSVEEYNERRRTRDQAKCLDREAFIRKLVLEEPTRVILVASKYRLKFARPRGQWILRLPEEYAATALLPPLILVNHEYHAVASAHYRRAFRGIGGGGGVLAGYPTVLYGKDAAFELLRADDLDLVQGFILENQRLETEGIRYYVSPKYHGE
ncbi:hypothetical protein E0Z10_g977 [Xylaria hypoxylon]|uniref:Uncharacterized protein n=1 Tax=Xylaria hypoxylon TaxID=37992 RepID=A0A4Z0Z8I2_9PEZI|nr:hypothetical protein E0Z10_g977 [Xylaria hypoxylon]